MKTFKICEGHSEYPTPLIWTFAFPYYEYWCPFCGAKGGMLGTGREVAATQELDDRYMKFKEFSNEFLHANGVQVCASTLWEGERVTPDRLPQHEKDRLQKIIDDWSYGIKIETTTRLPEIESPVQPPS